MMRHVTVWLYGASLVALGVALLSGADGYLYGLGMINVGLGLALASFVTG
jgi:hypothetical protein